MRHTFLSTLAKHKHKILPCALYHYSTSTYQIQAISAKFLVFYLLTLIHRFTLITVGVKFGFCWGKVWGVVVRRVLVLIQVGLAALARDKHTPKTKLDCRNDNNAPTDARSPLSRLAILRIFPVGADVDFIKPGWPDDLPSVSLLHLPYHLGADLPDIHPILKAGEVIKKQELLILHPDGTHHVVIQNIGFEILG